MSSSKHLASTMFPQSLHQYATCIKPLLFPLFSQLYSTFVGGLGEMGNMSVFFPEQTNAKYQLPNQARDLLREEIIKYVDNYLNQHTFSDELFALANYIHEDPKAGPWVPRMAREDFYEGMRAPASGNPSGQAAKRVPPWNDGEPYAQTFQSTAAGRIITERSSEFLRPDHFRGFQKARSTTGLADQNVHANAIKPRRCSSVMDGPTTKRRVNKCVNRSLSTNNRKGMTTTRAQDQLHSESTGSVKSGKEKKSHKCSDCGKVFEFEARLKSHQAVHSKAKYHCLDCGSEFGRQSSLKRHYQTPGACLKKKESKRRNASFQNSPRPSSQNHFNFGDIGAAASASSVIDNVSVHSIPTNSRISTQNGFHHQPQSPLWHDFPIVQGQGPDYESYSPNMDSHQNGILDPALSGPWDETFIGYPSS